MTSAGAGAASSSLGFKEFVTLAAAMMATQAFPIDAMLPALPTIANALGLTDQNRGQWVVTAYAAGVGLGQLFWGVLSDRFGRRPILLIGLVLYTMAALLCASASSFGALLLWRLAHGIAAAAMVVARSVIRDLYDGRHMARVMSLTFIVFLMIPVVAPSIGQLILWVAPWRYIFLILGLFAGAVAIWTGWRLPETLHPEYRLQLNVRQIASAMRLVLVDRVSLNYTLAITLMFGALLAYVAMVQQIFAQVFHRAALMPPIFAICAVAMGITSYLNSRIVERVGMRAISQISMLLFILIAALHVVVAYLGGEGMLSFVAFQCVAMGCFGLAVANFSAMAMEPLGAVAGIGASLQGFVSTLGGALLGAWIGRYFDGTTLPLALGTLICAVLSMGFLLIGENGQLFRAHHLSTDATGDAAMGGASLH